jgi:hypothetical protein
MGGERHAQGARAGTGSVPLLAVTLALMLGGCGTSSLTSSIFGTSQKGSDAAGVNNQASVSDTDVDCPDVKIRNGAATLLIGSKPSDQEPAAMDVRYQGSIIRTARECHLNAGIMTMKVGIEGRVITGPAGGPGAVDVPLRVAIVQEGVAPKMITSKLGHEQVTISNAVDRVTFAHVETDIVFPMPQPAANISAYVAYVGFDSQGAPQPKKPAPKHKSKPIAKKPKPNPQPSQS